MVEFTIEYGEGPAFRHDVTDYESVIEVKDMTGHISKDTGYISEITVDGVSSAGEDYGAFDEYLDEILGPFDPMIIQIMNDPNVEDEKRIETAMAITGGDIPSVFPNILMKNLYPTLYQQYYENWRRMTVEKARDKLSLIELESTGQTGFVDSIFQFFEDLL